MSTPYFRGEFLEKQGTTVHLRLTSVYPDEIYFGTDRYFAWMLLSNWVSIEDDADDSSMARQYIKRVEVSPLSNGTVAEKHPGYFSVKPEDKNPSVIYTIEVTDESILHGINIGDHGDVYERVDFDKIILDDDPVIQPDANSGRTEQTVISLVDSKSFEDFQNAIFTLLHTDSASTWLKEMVNHLVTWSQDASEAQIMTWLNQLPIDEGWLCQGEARMAVQKCVEGKLDAAHNYLAIAERALPKSAEEDDWMSKDALKIAMCGLIPAWWRLGKVTEANNALEKLQNMANDFDNISEEDVANMIALGGREEDILEKIPESLPDDYFYLETLRPGLFSLYASGAMDLLQELLRRWSQTKNSHGNPELSCGLLRLAIRRGKSGDYLELARSYPQVLDQNTCRERALVELERTSPSEAIRFAKMVLSEGGEYHEPKLRALSILATHAPKEANAWIKGVNVLTDQNNLNRFAYLAALGQDEKASKGLQIILQQSNHYPTVSNALQNLAIMTRDRTVAIAALKSIIEHPSYRAESYYCYRGDELPQLFDLGEQAYVNEYLTRWLDEIKTLVPKERDLYCRAFAKAAGMVGSMDLARKAIGLPTKSVRYCSAGTYISGCVSVSDWTGAMTALALLPELSDRISSAFQQGLSVAELAFVDGPRSRPMRCLNSPEAPKANEDKPPTILARCWQHLLTFFIRT